MADTASDHPNTNYPSPSEAARVPFYSQSRDDWQDVDEEDEQDGGLEVRVDGRQGDVPDDPQMRANLERMMGQFSGGSFGTFTAMPPPAHHHHDEASHSPSGPHESIAFPQATEPLSSQSMRERAPRSKVSRACDECRRKKIRCDAGDETGANPCTSCSRAGYKCAFSRQPLKRGPSKGYIKELAERLQSLEQQVHEPNMQPQHQIEIRQVQQAIADSVRAFPTQQHDQQPPVQYVQQRNGLTASVEPRTGEKRSFSVAEGMYANGSTSNGGWNSSNQPTRTAASTPQPSVVQASVASTPLMASRRPSSVMQPFWRHHGGGFEMRPDTTALPYDTEVSTVTGPMITSFDWNEEIISEYYRLIHQTFPLLPSNKNRLRQRLTECPASLREAFLAALDCLMRTFPTTVLPANPGYAQALKRTAELLAKYPFDNPSTHTPATNLVYLQTLLLMALESDNHGPATIRGQAGPSRAEWLGRAAGVAGQLEINTLRSKSASIMDGDRDSEERLARRVWWVLFILDRWHASSTADLLKLPENSVILLPEDQMLLGESTYHLARLSFIIGHLAAILTTTKTPSTDVMAPSNPASSLIGMTLAGEIDRFRESVESTWGSLNLVHLSYHHCHLLIKRLNPLSEPVELVGHAVKVATVLNSRHTPVTPLNHHFGALAAMTLCELCDIPKTRSEALRGLEQMVECLGQGRGLAGKVESEGWDGAIREMVVRKKERMMATQQHQQGNGSTAMMEPGANGGSDVEAQKFDPTMLTRYGYLTALGQGLFRTK